MDCEGFKNRRVKLGYVADSPTSVQLVDSIGNQVFDMLPIIQAGETDTSIELISDTRRIRYYPEKYTRTEGKDGCYYDICMEDLANLIYLNDLGDVNVPNPATGGTIIYNAATGQYEPYDLAGNIGRLDTRIDNLNTRIDGTTSDIDSLRAIVNENTRRINNLYEQVSSLTSRLSAIENAIYNWSSDKNTKIARGNINVTSGGYTSGNGIYTRTPNTNEDLNFN